MGNPDLLGQTLQALTQIPDVQQQQVAQQQDWLQHNLSFFKMPKMTQKDDSEAYIEGFEHNAIQARLDKGYWASQLGALVIGKAQATYRAMP